MFCRILNLGLLSLGVLSISHGLQAQETEAEVYEKRRSFSSLGIGLDIISYQEKTTLSFPDYPVQINGVDRVMDISVDIESDYGGTAWSQTASGYVSVNPQWGFYINSQGTLESETHEETWDLTGYSWHTTDNIPPEYTQSGSSSYELQKNASNLEKTDFEVLVNYQFMPNQSVLFGGRHSSIEFKRFNASLTPAPADTDLLLSNVRAFDGDYAERTAATSVSVGYEYNTLYTSSKAGWYAQYQAVLNLPLYHSVINTGLSEDAFTDSFHGFSVKLFGLYGYQITENFTVAGSLSVFYQQFDAIEETITHFSGNEITAEIPENTFIVIQPAISTYWSF